MQIREIHIERFGKFSHCRVVPVSSGLNVIYGRNEFGKTTLLEFIRWILFGFEKKTEGCERLHTSERGRAHRHDDV